MKTFILAIIISFACFPLKAQVMATDAKITTDKNGTQCASTGIGSGRSMPEAKENASKNREAAEKSARESKSGEGKASIGKGSGEARCDRPRGRNNR